tara:strand:+ start:1795 stop:2046 length:252 start_codon:yes stop_codon:yes gene_type:complete
LFDRGAEVSLSDIAIVAGLIRDIILIIATVLIIIVCVDLWRKSVDVLSIIKKSFSILGSTSPFLKWLFSVVMSFPGNSKQGDK